MNITTRTFLQTSTAYTLSLLAMQVSLAFSQVTTEQPAQSAASTKSEVRRARDGEASVRPGINDSYLAGDLDVDLWLARFEVESREVFAARKEILAALKIKPGMHVADIGAGTGVYSGLLARAVGRDGWVHAVDIVPKFLEHIAKRARAERITNLSTVLCQEDAIAMPPRSIDLAFTCDAYHHFEFPQSTLRSIRRALKPGGRLAVVDFERIPGKSREWTLNHVRAGKETVRKEIEQAGFVFVEEPKIRKLEENYVMIFQAPKSNRAQ